MYSADRYDKARRATRIKAPFSLTNSKAQILPSLSQDSKLILTDRTYGSNNTIEKNDEKGKLMDDRTDEISVCSGSSVNQKLMQNLNVKLLDPNLDEHHYLSKTQLSMGLSMSERMEKMNKAVTDVNIKKDNVDGKTKEKVAQPRKNGRKVLVIDSEYLSGFKLDHNNEDDATKPETSVVQATFSKRKQVLMGKMFTKDPRKTSKSEPSISNEVS